MSYRVLPTAIDGLLVLEPTLFGDARGFFLESYNQHAFEAAVGQPHSFVQDNHSRSRKGVLRGLHLQVERPQGKLVRVTRGAVWDVAVDLRPGSASFGAWEGVVLSEENHRQFWIPPGFAHGFIVLSDEADFLYKTTEYYAPELERCIRWDDARLAIAWPDAGVAPILSDRDRQAGSLEQFLKDMESGGD